MVLCVPNTCNPSDPLLGNAQANYTKEFSSLQSDIKSSDSFKLPQERTPLTTKCIDKNDFNYRHPNLRLTVGEYTLEGPGVAV